MYTQSEFRSEEGPNVRLEISPLQEPVGALVYGWQPEEELTVQERDAIVAGLRQHLVLVFRGHPQPSDAALVSFARHFGDLVKGSEWFRDAGTHPAEILPVSNTVGVDGVPEGSGGSMELEWHSDYSYVELPGKESFLEAVELPDDPPFTSFCSQYVALETLPPTTVQRLRKLRAFHSITNLRRDGRESAAQREYRAGYMAKRARDEALGVERPKIPDAEHPVIMRHPDSGRELLYVSPGITRYIVGVPRDESNSLLQELHEHSTRPEGVYAHQWEVGDMIVFDTLGAMHRREAWDPTQRRRMRQLSTMLTGEPYAAQAH